MKATKAETRRPFPWDWIYVPFLYIILFWSVVQIAYGGESGPMDIIQIILNAIGLSQQSVSLILLVLALGVAIWVTIAKYCQTLKFLKENVGPAEVKESPANKGISKIIGDVAAVDGKLTPLGEITGIKTSADAAATGIGAANAKLEELDKDVAILKNQAKTIQQIQLTNPREAKAFQGAEAAFLSLAEELIRQNQENKDLREELAQCYEKISDLEKQISELRPAQRHGMQPHL